MSLMVGNSKASCPKKKIEATQFYQEVQVSNMALTSHSTVPSPMTYELVAIKVGRLSQSSNTGIRDSRLVNILQKINDAN